MSGRCQLVEEADKILLLNFESLIPNIQHESSGNIVEDIDLLKLAILQQVPEEVLLVGKLMMIFVVIEHDPAGLI